MYKHSFSFEQYCKIVDKNIVLEETTYHNGEKNLKCLNLYKCKEKFGGCKNSYVLERIKRTVEKTSV